MAVQLNIADGANYAITGLDMPPPAPKPAYASSYDTEGSIASDPAHYENREITVRLRVYGADAADLEANLNAVYQWVGQVNREDGMVLDYTTPSGSFCFFDLLPEATATVALDQSYVNNRRADMEIRLVAKPFWRGAEVDLGTVSETSLPVLVGTWAGVGGDVPALGRIVITDTESGGKDRWTVIVAGESRYYSADATAALFYQAEDLTPLATSTKTAGASGASGSGSNVVRNTDLTTTYQAVLKSEIDASNAALTHKGTFRVWARIYRPTGNTGAVSVRLEWGEGDYTRVTLNDPVAYAADDREGVFTWANLGVVSIDPASTRWEFRLLAKSTVAGDEIDADCFVLFPTEVVYTELSGRLQFQNPTSFVALSTFDTESGAITGDSATVGGAWVGAGDADDASVAGGVATRTAVSDTTNVGRYLISGASALTAQTVQIDFKHSALQGAASAVVARYTDTNNWLMVTAPVFVTSQPQVQVLKKVAGSLTVIKLAFLSTIGVAAPPVDNWMTVRLQVDVQGRWFVWLFPQGTLASRPVISGQDAVLATGGALASGKPGWYDEQPNAGAVTRTYDNFLAFAPSADAALFGQRTMTLKHDTATRQDSGGTFSTKISDRRGRYLKIPPAGPETRSTRLAILAVPNDPYTMGDAAAIHDLSAQLFVTPRGLVVPEA